MPATHPPLAVYVHIPWCERKCPYCDFNSHPATGALPEREYVAALLADLDQELAAVAGRSVTSIFIGGGTPSLFGVPALSALLDGLRARLEVAGDAEITLEANPGSSEQQRFAGYREIGVNRLSLGIQSFNDASLRALGRVHSACQGRAAIDMARAAGFDNLNLDLMHGLPGQTLAQAVDDVELAIAADPPHLSYYQLTLEPNTYFHRYPPPLPDEDSLAAIERYALPRLAQAGYARYEVSAYARPGHRSRHNLNYWQFGDYLGIGAGAHGKLTLRSRRRVHRYVKQRQPRAYLAAASTASRVVSQRDLEDADLIEEFLLNALRLSDGFEVEAFSLATGLPYARIAARVTALCGDGLLQTDGVRVAATATGYRFLDDVIARFDERAA